MNVLHEFSRFAKQYNSYNIIQNRVAKKLVSMLSKKKYETITDIGCGSGAIYKRLISNDVKFSRFKALDFSKEMLELHYSANNIQKIPFDFNRVEDFNLLNSTKEELIISSSALQWSKNIEITLEQIVSTGEEFYFSFFTSNTFKTLHEIADISSPIYSKEKILEVLKKYYIISFEIEEYQLKFKNIREMFKYIKKSGVNGEGNRLKYRDIKKIMSKYPYNYLEFEVLFVVGSVKPTTKISRP